MEHVRVGIGVFVKKDGQFLMGKRMGAHGEGSWSLPGGHLEFNETFTDTAKREVLEETGMEVTNVRFAAITNDCFKKENKHYITIWVIADHKDGKPKILEPDKCVAQKWCTFNSLPFPLFLPWEQLLKSEFLEKLQEEFS